MEIKPILEEIESLKPQVGEVYRDGKWYYLVIESDTGNLHFLILNGKEHLFHAIPWVRMSERKPELITKVKGFEINE